VSGAHLGNVVKENRKGMKIKNINTEHTSPFRWESLRGKEARSLPSGLAVNLCRKKRKLYDLPAVRLYL